MRPGEFLICTFQGDTNVPPVIYPQFGTWTSSRGPLTATCPPPASR